ncbi:antitoxin (plasmid) [Alloyangia pacifica]|uniref:Antitoxin n=1 Tax=Alloyangia pacifica TaxID=311180 RepID=A0A2U8HL96_9RHOB|nr:MULTISPECIES: antitoxin Xre/MbcA/ParS toxin-binding domain-containing protein [Roseobacteraceae]AWI86647.1 antitoxin [Alloyangia pacifica]NDV48939.1 DUF2384 domain-containing protein [Salipiger sp. PrR003]NDW31202.1 DUF2384 domain-containing protein [Salipiger sp. PrR007]
MQAIHFDSDIGRAVHLLGGEKTMDAKVNSALDAHEVLMKGLPAGALLHLVSSVGFLDQGPALYNAVGISVRTLQRMKAKGADELLSREQSSRAWRFAEIFGKAIEVLGSEAAAVDWMNKPAIGLERRCPIDLVATSAGAEVVEEYLTRMEYGVYT